MENPVNGFVSKTRVSRVDRYPAAFTPPSSFVNDADTIALYQFSEGSGTNVADSSGHSLNMTIQGTTPTWTNINLSAAVYVTTNMTLVTAADQINFQPAAAYATMLVEAASVTTNDVTLSVSRDGGSTFTAAVLTNSSTWSISNILFSAVGGVDLSGQPAGSNIVLKVTTTSNDVYKVMGVAAPCN